MLRPALNPVFCQKLLSFGFQSVEDDSEHDLAWMADEGYGPVVLALPKVSFLLERYDKGLGPISRPFLIAPDLLTQ